MPTPDKELEDRYDASGGEVRITVIIGQAQIGRSRVYLDGNRIHDSSNVWKVLVGSGIEGSEVMVRSVISDVNRNTNRVSAKYILEGGAAPREWELEDEVAEEGEDVYFRAKFEIV